MRTLDHTLAVVFIMALSSAMASAAPAPAAAPAQPEAAAPVPAAAPEPAAPVAPKVPVPRHKPDPLDDAYIPPGTKTASATVPASASTPVVAAAAPAAKPRFPFPRAKPGLQLAAAHLAGPFPRTKPSPTLASASPSAAPTPPAPQAAAPLAPPASAPAPAATPAPAAAADASACGDACNEVLFRTLNDCLWVQNANPRPVTFAAKVGGSTITLALAGADAAKADAHKPFEPKEGLASPIGEGAYHTRISDPFSPSAPGIAVYRAKLGTASGCVKDRNQVTSFTASFAAPAPSAPHASN